MKLELPQTLVPVGQAGGWRSRRGVVARAFTLVEVLLSVFILAIGMIMVITIFPIGGDWTRQATETTISQAVAQNALTIIQSHYPTTGPLSVTSTTLVEFPGLRSTTPGTGIPVSEMCYQFGSSAPCPADFSRANYFWTALVRKIPGQPDGTTRKFDVFILVFKKGSNDHQYSTMPQNFTEVGSRSDSHLPAIAKGPYPTGSSYDTATGKVLLGGNPLVPGIGEYGIGETSGTVFRQSAVFSNGTPTGATVPRPDIARNPSTENIIIGVPQMSSATNPLGPSPLVYVFQTSISWKVP